MSVPVKLGVNDNVGSLVRRFKPGMHSPCIGGIYVTRWKELGPRPVKIASYLPPVAQRQHVKGDATKPSILPFDALISTGEVKRGEGSQLRFRVARISLSANPPQTGCCSVLTIAYTRCLIKCAWSGAVSRGRLSIMS